MIKEIKKWREDFQLKTDVTAASAMLTEEYDESFEALEEYLDNPHDKTKKHLARELADVIFVVVQLAESVGVDIEQVIQEVLESNYTKRMTKEQAEEAFKKHPMPLEAEAIERDGYVYLYRHGKLLKPPTFKPLV